MVWNCRGHHSARSDLGQCSDKFFSSGGVPFFPELRQSLIPSPVGQLQSLEPSCHSFVSYAKLNDILLSFQRHPRVPTLHLAPNSGDLYSEHIVAVSDKTLQRVKPNVKPYPIFDHYLTDDTRNNRNLGISWFQEERGTHVRSFGLRMNHNVTDRKSSHAVT